MKQRRLIKMPPVLVMHIRGDPWKVKCHDRAYFWSSVGLLSYLWCLSNYGSSDVARLIILSIWYSYSWGWSHGQTSRVMGYLLVHSLVCSYRSFAIACPAFLACYAHLFACPLTHSWAHWKRFFFAEVDASILYSFNPLCIDSNSPCEHSLVIFFADVPDNWLWSAWVFGKLGKT